MSDFVHEPECGGADHIGFPCPGEAQPRTEPTPFTGAEIADLHDYPSFIVQRLIATINEFAEGVIRQWGYWSERDQGLGSGGLSQLEEAFELLGWEDPHPMPDRACDEPGCTKDATCGWPSKGNEFVPAGYRRTCGPHMRQYMEVP